MSSQHVYYNGDNYDYSGPTYDGSGYERPYDQFYNQFTPHPAYGMNRPPYGNPYSRSDEAGPKRKRSSKKDSPRQDYDGPRKQDPKERRERPKENGAGPKESKKGQDLERSPEESSASPKGAMHIVDKHTDKFSMSGVGYIKSSKNPVVKVVWSVLLIAATAALGYHLYRIVSTFLEYNKNTSVELGFSSLQFPAVTFCNVNPLRMSRLNEATPEFRDFIKNVDPAKLAESLDTWTPEYDVLEDYFGEGDDDGGFDDGDDSGATRKRKRRNAQESAKVRNNNFLDVVKVDFTDSRQTQDALDSLFDEEQSGSWESEAKISSFFKIEQNFREQFAWELPTERAELGHQISDMLLQCSFAGRQCLARNFTRLLTSDFGNCYTIQYDKFVSRKSGPKYGLELKLYLQTDEYVPGIATSKGIQVVIHEQGTHPFPGNQGMAIQAGAETRIGLKVVEVSRLDQPYGHCRSTEDFEKKYSIRYTRSACQNICLYERTLSTCGCYDVLSEETRNLVRRNLNNATACANAEEIKCLERVAIKFDNDEGDCECHSPCSEKLYEKTVTSREWPATDFSQLLVSTVCKNNPEDCAVLSNLTVAAAREEFIKLVVYFEELNYEKIEESPAYEIFQFMSDIGGTMGLYLGLSILAAFEVFNLILELSIFVCTGKRKK